MAGASDQGKAPNRSIGETVTHADSWEATVTRGASFTADAVLSPAEFVEVLDAVSAAPSTASGTGRAGDATVQTEPEPDKPSVSGDA
jgi:hypothetical protein